MSDGKYYWLKLKRDFFKRHDIRIIEGMPCGKDILLFYLKLLAESVDHEGRLRFSEQIPYTNEMLAVITNTDSNIVEQGLKILTDLNMVEIMPDGTFFMAGVERMTGSASDNENANRQRRYRERQKAISEESVTKCNASVTDSVTENNESKSKSKNKRKSKSILCGQNDYDFEQIEKELMEEKHE